MQRDSGWLLDILLAARRVVQYTQGVSEEQFLQDPIRQDAVAKRLEIIGEAAGQLTQAFRDAHPEIPWRLIVGMRHRLVHAYFDIDLPRVWAVAVQDVPELVRRIEPLVPPDPG